MFPILVFISFKYWFEREREHGHTCRGRGRREGGRESSSRLPMESRTHCSAGSLIHELMIWPEITSQTLNWLNYPDTPSNLKNTMMAASCKQRYWNINISYHWNTEKSDCISILECQRAALIVEVNWGESHIAQMSDPSSIPLPFPSVSLQTLSWQSSKLLETIPAHGLKSHSVSCPLASLSSSSM